MKKISLALVPALFAVLLFLSGPARAGAPEILLPASPDAVRTVPPFAESFRHRLVVVDFDALGAASTPSAEGGLRLRLFEDLELPASRVRLEHRPGGFTWFGRIEGEPLSNVILTVEGGSLAGKVVASAGTFLIRLAGGEWYAVEELDSSRFPPEAPPLEAELPALEPPGRGVDAGDDGTLLDVMVVYSQSVTAYSANIDAEVQLAVDETNATFANSGVNTRLRLVHHAEVYYLETGNSQTDLNCLRAKGDGCLDEVHDWRDLYGADMVSLWTYSSDYCGRGALMTTVSPAFESSAFTVVKQSCATGYLTFGHEFGHVMGCHHDRYVEGSRGAYEYSHGLAYPPDRWRTVMAYDNECSNQGFSCTRIMYWTNPEMEYGGVAMGFPEGDPQSADNRKTLNNTAFTVANFRQSLYGAVPDVKGNGADGPLLLRRGAPLEVTVALETGGRAGEDADWWIVLITPFPFPYTIFSGDLSGQWAPGFAAGNQGPCEALEPTTVFASSTLPTGGYLFAFALDMNMNGRLDIGEIYYDILPLAVLP